jgi:hypothetical protein
VTDDKNECVVEIHAGETAGLYSNIEWRSFKTTAHDMAF